MEIRRLNDEEAPGLQDPLHFGKERFDIGHVLENVEKRHDIETVARETDFFDNIGEHLDLEGVSGIFGTRPVQFHAHDRRILLRVRPKGTSRYCTRYREASLPP